MFLRPILYAVALLSILFLGIAARNPDLFLARIQEIRLQEKSQGFSILESGSLIRFTPEAEYKFPLWAVIKRAQSKRFSNELLNDLYQRGGTEVPVWELPSHLRLQAIYHTDSLIRDRQFTARNILNDQGFESFVILPENQDFYFAYAFADGTIFYKETKIEFHSGPRFLARSQSYPIALGEAAFLRPDCTCRPQGPKSPPLVITLDHATPDLSTEFLRILANPDSTVY